MGRIGLHECAALLSYRSVCRSQPKVHVLKPWQHQQQAAPFIAQLALAQPALICKFRGLRWSALSPAPCVGCSLKLYLVSTFQSLSKHCVVDQSPRSEICIFVEFQFTEVVTASVRCPKAASHTSGGCMLTPKNSLQWHTGQGSANKAHTHQTIESVNSCNLIRINSAFCTSAPLCFRHTFAKVKGKIPTHFLCTYRTVPVWQQPCRTVPDLIWCTRVPRPYQIIEISY